VPTSGRKNTRGGAGRRQVSVRTACAAGALPWPSSWASAGRRLAARTRAVIDTAQPRRTSGQRGLSLRALSLQFSSRRSTSTAGRSCGGSAAATAPLSADMSERLTMLPHLRTYCPMAALLRVFRPPKSAASCCCTPMKATGSWKLRSSLLVEEATSGGDVSASKRRVMSCVSLCRVVIPGIVDPRD